MNNMKFKTLQLKGLSKSDTVTIAALRTGIIYRESQIKEEYPFFKLVEKKLKKANITAIFIMQNILNQ